jgi:hypothetical protein
MTSTGRKYQIYSWLLTILRLSVLNTMKLPRLPTPTPYLFRSLFKKTAAPAALATREYNTCTVRISIRIGIGYRLITRLYTIGLLLESTYTSNTYESFPKVIFTSSNNCIGTFSKLKWYSEMNQSRKEKRSNALHLTYFNLEERKFPT